LTPAFRLALKSIIHTVGPSYVDGLQGEPEVLANCYRSVLRMAALTNVASVGIPAISCGARGFPIDEAAQIAVKTLQEELPALGPIAVTLVSFNARVHSALRRALVAGSGEYATGGG
jgi:O-acetyl-ADP-ribose deacetylase (regulator of RNase III)